MLVLLMSSAAPTVLCAHYFETVDYHTGSSRSFNDIDGVLAANNPEIYTSLVIVCGWVFLPKSCVNLIVRFD
jgi:patatin-like phospholipase/acyl hydrolase